MSGDLFRLVGSSGVSSRLQAFGVTSRLVQFADQMGPLLQQAMRAKAPRGHGEDAGRMADSVRYRRRTGLGVVRLEFHSDAPHAPFVVGGTRPHDIVPKAARVLHWTSRTGASVFARRVHHPGTKANPFPRVVVREHAAQINAVFRRAMEDPRA